MKTALLAAYRGKAGYNLINPLPPRGGTTDESHGFLPLTVTQGCHSSVPVTVSRRGCEGRSPQRLKYVFNTYTG